VFNLEEAEVFRVKKSSHSKRIAKQLKKEKKERERGEKQTKGSSRSQEREDKPKAKSSRNADAEDEELRERNLKVRLWLITE